MSSKLFIKDVVFNGKKALIRVDFNVPLDEEGKILDDSRIKAALPTIHHVLDHGGAVILMSHLGRPEKPSPEFSLAPVAKRLSELLGTNVILSPEVTGPETEALARDLHPGQVLLLENLRFNPAEKKPSQDPEFANQLAKLADLYIDDAFGSAHREHTSVTSVPKLFPGAAAAGLLMEKEIDFLGNTLKNPARPFYALLGGAKVSTKFGVLKSLLKKVNGLIIGGGMAYTFLKAKGISIGNSIHEDKYIGLALEILEDCDKNKISVLLPQDVVIVENVKQGSPSKIIDVSRQGIPSGWQGVDIGPKTIKEFSTHLKKAKTIFWNGPVGVFEVPEFAKGTYAIAELLADLDALTIVGGGDSLSAINTLGIADKMTFVSTGGGASLEFIEKGTLPGIEALSNKTVKVS
jgi:phosphoglycerate kinase